MIAQVGAERFATPELIFDPAPVVAQFPEVQSLQQSIIASAMSVEADIRRETVGSIVLTGAASCFEGMPARLKTELEPLTPAGTKVHVTAAEAPDRALGPWLGGSILGSLGTFHDMWFSAAEYAEHGAKMIHRKMA
jgi:actin-related protein